MSNSTTLWTSDDTLLHRQTDGVVHQGHPARLERTSSGLAVSGDWTRLHVRNALNTEHFEHASGWITREISPVRPGVEEPDLLKSRDHELGSAPLQIDASQLGELDTLGCLALSDLQTALGKTGQVVHVTGLSRDKLELYEAVRERADLGHPSRPVFDLDDLIAGVGRGVFAVWNDVLGVTGMMGMVLASIGQTLVNPSRWRFNAFVTQVDYSGLRAVPIIVLIQLVIGGIVAQQSAWQLRFFGAEIFAVDLIAILVLREMGVLISAIMVAGRTGSAYTAEMGAMRMREEVDAMRVIGLDPVDVLVVPRILGLIVALPLLTVIANGAALLGGMATLWIYSGIDPTVFIERMHNVVLLETVFVGLIKAPFMALAIGCIACVEGFRVQGSTESLGQRVTAAVVKSIFIVIVLDGVFAIFFASMNY
ncbi:MAG: ABC transporter permease [Pseudomonadota bacterium]